jgi:hypothetical protein
VTATDGFHKEQVDEMIKENRRITQKTNFEGFKGTRIMICCNVTRSHTSCVTVEAIGTLDLNILPHRPYSLDLASCDFRLFL